MSEVPLRIEGAPEGAVAEAGPGIMVNPAAFDDLLPPEAGAVPPRAAAGNLELLLDVEVRVTACLGSVRKSIGEVLGLTEGQVIDLDRAAGEPVEVLVNGRLVAKGEVVVVDERYGIRVTEILAAPEKPAR